MGSNCVLHFRVVTSFENCSINDQINVFSVKRLLFINIIIVINNIHMGMFTFTAS